MEEPMSHVYKLAVLAATATVAVAGCSGGGSETQKGTEKPEGGSSRTVQVKMVDRSFKAPALGTVKKGETITFKFTNTGKLDHEAFIGDAGEQLAYNEALQETAGSHSDGADDGHDHHPEGSIHLEPGATGELSYTFSDSDEVEIACYEPGMYEAGMKLVVQVQ
jgi:uncharacterized cupredoxin-like copper-binding protein